jgi:putative glutamine amidotransferase
MTNDRDINEREKKGSDTFFRKRRRLRWVAVLFFILVAVCIFLRFVYPFLLQASLPDDAPRIAFSVDNSIIGLIGVMELPYQRVIAAVGGRLVKVRPDAVGTADITPEKVKVFLEQNNFQGILLSGGGDIDPEISGSEPENSMLVHRLRDDFEIALVHAARQLNLPILGICRGCQVINVALGGTVRNLRNEKDIKNAHLKIKGHPVTFAPDSKLIEILGVTDLQDAISTHGQAVDTIGSDLKIAATGPKGITEAIEADTTEWIIGLQFHPELTFNKDVQHKIFTEFVQQAEKR